MISNFHVPKVEFVEEVQADEVYVNYFNTPYDNGDGLWNVRKPTYGETRLS